ncbi:MAG: class I SAM-dependent methyltransferase [Gammaproteobacteria bacterium]|nr:class I SAM-dependent methyltransferase [Gammaproteobacteria bacterium]NNJ72272.1 class I SAM-dependent methyltransferase [Enterobacterales bacterium]
MAENLGYFDVETDSNTWGLPHINNPEQLKALDAWLFQKDGVLYLDQNKQPDLAPLSIDYASGKIAHRLKQTRHNKLPLAKACGLTKGRRPSIIDATAGFAQDGLLLAAMGSKVTLLEQHPLIFALVADALQRAASAELAWLETILKNIEHIHTNSAEYLQSNTLESQACDVIYLDPMYPERDKATSAQVKKGMQILRSLPDCYTNTQALFEAALAAAKQRVVVKRPSWAETITSLKPDLVVSMPNHHFDIYLTAVN